MFFQIGWCFVPEQLTGGVIYCLDHSFLATTSQPRKELQNFSNIIDGKPRPLAAVLTIPRQEGISNRVLTNHLSTKN
jgi:hypothetical protein